MRIKLLVLLISGIMTFSANAEVYRQVRVLGLDQQAMQTLGAFDIVAINYPEYVDIVVNEMEYYEFIKLDLPFQVIHDDLAEFYRHRYPVGLTMGGFRTYAEVVAVLDSLATDYPDLITARSSIGQSIEGRDLWMVKVSDNPNLDEDEPEIFINGVHHAREPITSEVCVEFIKELLENYEGDFAIADLVNNNEFYFVPIVNPDGYEYNRQNSPGGGGMWRKNRRLNSDATYGVDLNRNYTYNWGYDGNGSSPYTWSETYRGGGPGSEPEIQHMMQFTLDHDFAWIMNFHSHGNLLLWPWGYYHDLSPDNSVFWELFGDYAEDTLGYDAGAPWQLLYSTNGDANDWGYGEQRIKRKSYAMTIEIGNGSDGFWPPPDRIPVLIEENIQALLNFSAKAYELYKRRRPPAPSVFAPALAPADQGFFVHWSTAEIDTFNAAESYRLVEKSGYQRVTLDCESADDFSFGGFSLSSARHHGGNYSIYSGQGDEYRASATLAERLLVQTGDTLVFWTWFDIENNWDYAYVEVSNDGGISWQILNGNRSTNSNPNNHNEGYGITGNSGGWVEAKYYLDDFIGQQIDIKLRYWTDAAVINEGIYIDDISPYDDFLTVNVLSGNIYSDSFAVGPYAEGSRYYQVAARDDRADLSVLSDRFEVTISGNLYSLSGQVELADTVDNFEGTTVYVAGTGLGDTTDGDGFYSIPGIPGGTFDIIASHYGYYDSKVFDFNIESDTSLNFLLSKAFFDDPYLISPVDSFISLESFLDFSWHNAADAQSYLIEIATDNQFSNIVAFDSSLVLPTWTSGSLADGWHWWRVKASNGQSWTGYSISWGFLVNYDSTYTDFVPGDANGDGEVIGSDVTYLVSYFRGTVGPPEPFLAGDANGDCQVIGSDVTYLVNYFRGAGYPPVRGDCPAAANNEGLPAEDLINGK